MRILSPSLTAHLPPTAVQFSVNGRARLYLLGLGGAHSMFLGGRKPADRDPLHTHCPHSPSLTFLRWNTRFLRFVKKKTGMIPNQTNFIVKASAIVRKVEIVDSMAERGDMSKAQAAAALAAFQDVVMTNVAGEGTAM